MIDIAEFCTDYVTMLVESSERMPTREELVNEVVDALKDRGVDTTAELVGYYL